MDNPSLSLDDLIVDLGQNAINCKKDNHPNAYIEYTRRTSEIKERFSEKDREIQRLKKDIEYLIYELNGDVSKKKIRKKLVKLINK